MYHPPDKPGSVRLSLSASEAAAISLRGGVAQAHADPYMPDCPARLADQCGLPRRWSPIKRVGSYPTISTLLVPEGR